MYDTAHNSFRRLRATDFPTRFYELLLESDPRIRAMFARTDFDKQRDLFMHGVHMLLEFGAGRPTGRMAIDRLSKMHGHAGLKIPPTLYAVWAKTLLDTAREFDPEWSEDVRSAWEMTLRPGIDQIAQASTRPT